MAVFNVLSLVGVLLAAGGEVHRASGAAGLTRQRAVVVATLMVALAAWASLPARALLRRLLADPRHPTRNQGICCKLR